MADENQLKAITYGFGPVMVLAGPGSGKTFIITHRIRYLIEYLHVPPSKILVITFTVKAAHEMKSRYYRLDSTNASKISFGTFHSVFFQFIRLFNRNYSPRIISSDEQQSILRKILASNKYYLKNQFFAVEGAAELNDFISSYKTGMNVSYEYYEEDIFNKVYLELEETKKAINCIDYDDILLECSKMLSSYPYILKTLQEKFDYILVDEYQDINHIQFDIVNLLAGIKKNIFVVGDDDQSIYGFRGASLKFMSDFMKMYDCEKISLTNNYRCPQKIIDIATNIIKHNSLRFKSDIPISKSSQKGNIIFNFFDNRDDENSFIGRIIDNTKDISKLCILVRTNKDVAYYRELFGGEISSRQKYNKLQKTIYTTVHAYVSFALNKDRDSILKIIRVPETYISGNIFLEDKIDLHRLCNMFTGSLKGQSLSVLCKNFEILSKLSPYAFVTYLLNIVGLKNYYANSSDLNFRGNYWHIFEDILNEAKNMTNLEDLYEYTVYQETQEILDSKISIMTFHASKGLEFDTVIIPRVNEGNIPERNLLGNNDIEEERRLFYVAMTRASVNLYISAIKNEGSNRLLPSRFIADYLK